jgi:uncharacterized protein YijF (DUF1287 family)
VSSSSAQDVTPLQAGDSVSWRTATGYRTGGVIDALLDAETARVRVLRGRADSFGLVTIGLAKLKRENPL